MQEYKKFYVQLRPDEESIRHLKEFQKHSASGQAVSERELHLTVIHFGKIEEQLAKFAGSDEHKQSIFRQYVDKNKRLHAEYADILFELQPVGIELFGANNSTLVIRYTPSYDLSELHSSALELFKRFIRDMGIEDAEVWMKDDPNFRYALELKPHITIARGYDGDIPDSEPSLVRLKLMKLLYEH